MVPFLSIDTNRLRAPNPQGHERSQQILLGAAIFVGVPTTLTVLSGLPRLAGSILLGGLWVAGIAYFLIKNNLVDSYLSVRSALESLNGANTYEVVDQLKKLRRKSFQKEWINVTIAQVLFDHGDSVGAERYVRRVKVAKNNVRLLYLKALILQQKQEWQASIDTLEAVLRFDQSAAVYVSLAFSYLGLGNPAQAEPCLFQALGADPANPLVYYYLAVTYEILGRGEESAKYYAFFLASKDETTSPDLVRMVEARLGPTPSA